MTTLSVIAKDGGAASQVELDDAWLEREKGTQAVQDAVVAHLCALRSGTASAKTRGQVRGGGAKPWRQKGTGRARAGTSRSPLWRHGGVIFPPIPRDYTKKINKKVKHLALKRAFTERVDEGSVLVVEATPSLEAPKSKEVAKWLKTIGAGTHVLVVVEELNEVLQLSARNMPNVEVVTPASLNTYDVLLFHKLVFTRAALLATGERLS